MCNSILNVINPWDVRASLLKETGMATGEVGLVNTYICIHMCKVNQHTLPASTIPWHILPILSLRVEPISIEGSSSGFITKALRMENLLGKKVPKTK